METVCTGERRCEGGRRKNQRANARGRETYENTDEERKIERNGKSHWRKEKRKCLV